MTHTRLLSAVCLLFLAGCAATPLSSPQLSSVVPPSSWRTNLQELQETRLEPSVNWWRAFDDVVLDELIEQAIVKNSDIEKAAARVMRARALLKGSSAARFPEINFASSDGYSRTVTLGKPVTTLGGTSNLSISWEADFFGRFSNADAAAKATLLSSRAGHGAVALAIVSSTAQTYFELLGADARFEILSKTVDIRQQNLSKILRLVDAGYASRLELRQAESELRTSTQPLEGARLERSQLENALSVLIGDLPHRVERSNTLMAVEIPALPERLPATLLRSRPDLVAAEATVVAAGRTLNSAQAATWPNLILNAAIGGVYGDTLPHALTIFNIGAGLAAPIFDAGRRKAVVDEKDAERNEVAAEYRSITLSAFQEVENHLAATVTLRAELQEVGLKVEADAQRARIVNNRSDIGYSSAIERLDARRQLLSSQLGLVAAKIACLNNYIGLIKSMGGGWSVDNLGKKVYSSDDSYQ